MKKFISIFLVMCMVLPTIGVATVSAAETEAEPVTTGTRQFVNAEITNFRAVTNEIVDLYGEDKGYYVLTDATDSANPVYTAMSQSNASSNNTSTLNLSGQPSTPYSSAIYKKNDDGTYTQVEGAYQGLQGETGFKNITMNIPGTVSKTTYGRGHVAFSGGTTGTTLRMNFRGTSGDYANINFITDPITSGKIEYGYTLNLVNNSYWGSTTEGVDVGGVGELKDSSINGEYISGVYNTDDKIVRARFDAVCGFAIYNNGEWDTLVAKADISAGKDITVDYALDLASHTFDITVYNANTDTTVTRTNVPFCITNYNVINAIEFNTLGTGYAYYNVKSIYMKELLPDTITGDYNGKGSENVLTEGKSITIENGAILRNAIIDATLGNVVIGETTVKGNMTFNEEGQLDVAENGTLNLKKAGDTENTYHWGLIKKVELSEVTSPYYVTLTADNGYTYDAIFNLGTEGTFTGTARLLIGVRNVPEGVEITAE